MLTLALSRKIAELAEQAAHAQNCRAISVAIVDIGGNVILLQRQDGCSGLRPDIAVKMAQGAIGMGCRSSSLEKLMSERPMVGKALSDVSGDRIFPLAGGVPIRSQAGQLIGAVGVSGEHAPINEILAVQAIEDAGLIAGS